MWAFCFEKKYEKKNSGKWEKNPWVAADKAKRTESGVPTNAPNLTHDLYMTLAAKVCNT